MRTFTGAPGLKAEGLDRPNAAMGEASFPQDTPGAAPFAEADPGAGRRIIYNAELSLVVEDFDSIQNQIPTLVQAAHGYIAEMDVIGSPGSRRSARWKFRIPVLSFESFLTQVGLKGELEKNSRTSQDITEQFTDLEARVKNKKVEEARLQQILADSTGKIEDVLRVETELSRVRGEIEQAEGRLRMLDNLSSLTTINLSVHEREKFVPPAPMAASFPTRVQRTFQDSVQRLGDAGAQLVLWFVAILPWLPFWLIGLAVAYVLARWLLRLVHRNAGKLWAMLNTSLATRKNDAASTAPLPQSGSTPA